MKDVSFVASLTATMMSDYFHRDDEVEEYLERYNEEFEEAGGLEERYRAVFDAMNQMGFDRGSRAWKKADFYTLFIELDRAINREGQQLDFDAVGSRLSDFFVEVDAVRNAEATPEGIVGEYFTATLQSTNDRSARVKRGRAIRSILAPE
ncbi:hypothetical protein [Cribrihabitans neustonicus]|uniref:hypothetical protein n=1 Tax=Cribrihabitans neustonicus TaxID=1429085 RepID=UPI003B5C6CA7